MIYMNAKNNLVFLVIFLCLLKAQLACADTAIVDFVPEKRGEVVVDEGGNDFDEPDKGEPHTNLIASEKEERTTQSPPANPLSESVSGEVDKAIIEELVVGATQLTAPTDEDGGDEEGLESMANTLVVEKQRLAELELAHKELLDRIVASASDKQKEDTLSEKHLLTTGRQGTATSSFRDETFEQMQLLLSSSPKIDFKDFKPKGNIDLLGTADGLYKLLQYETALQIYKSIGLEKTGAEDNSWVLYQISNCYRNLNKFDDALNTYNEILAKYPDTYPAKEAHWYLEDLNWWKQWYGKAEVVRSARETTKSQSPLSDAEGK
ncbi:MAG: tetratricopeptide repeat protein [Candidatus Brocadiales bacterium]